MHTPSSEASSSSSEAAEALSSLVGSKSGSAFSGCSSSATTLGSCTISYSTLLKYIII